MAKKSKSKSKTKKPPVARAPRGSTKTNPGREFAKRIGNSAGEPTATGAAKTEGGVRPGSKLELVAGLLQRPEGCTAADVLAATGWPSVSLPQQAKAAGLTLSIEKEGRVSRYRGTAAAA